MTASHPYRIMTTASFEGPLDAGWIGCLFRGEQRVAHIVDEGDRGALAWHWRSEAEEHALDQHVASLPPLVDARRSMVDWCRDAFAAQLRREEREREAMQMRAEEQTVLQLAGIDGWGEWLVIDTPYDADRAKALARGHGALRVLAPRGKRPYPTPPPGNDPGPRPRRRP